MPQKSEPNRGHPDFGIIFVFAALGLIGLLFVASASFAYSIRNQSSPYHFAELNLGWLVLAGVLFLVFATRTVAEWEKASVAVFAAALLLSVLVLVPSLGHRANGAARWLVLGPIRIQPSEFLKLGLILAMSWWLTRKAGNPRRLWPGFTVGALLTCMSTAVVLKQNDLGTCIVIALIGFGLLFASGARKRYLAFFFLLLVSFAGLAIWKEPYRMDRIKAWTHPWAHKADEAYQVVQALYAFGDGGWHGTGLGQGRAKFFIPAPHTDFVFATIAEETGVFGPLIVLGLFGAIGYLGTRVARRSRTPFGRLAAVGIVLFLCGQAALNIAVVTGALPCTGVPLPFISYGGSSMVVGALALSFLFSLSRNTVRTAREITDEGDGDRRGHRRTHLPGPGSSLGPSRPQPRAPTPVRR